MSAVTVAELLVAFQGDTKGFDKANLSVRQNLVKTAVSAEETAEAMLHLAAGIGTAGAAYETASVQAATFTRVALDSAKASEVAASAFAAASKEVGTVEAALALASVAAKAAKTELAGTGATAVTMTGEMAALRAEIVSLNRAMASQSSANIAGKLDAGAVAAGAMQARVATLTAQMEALNAQLAATKATGFPSVPNGTGTVAGGSSFLNGANKVGKGFTKYATMPILIAGGAALAVGSEYEAATAQLQSFAGVSAEEVDRLRPKFLALAEATGQMPAELARAMFFIESGGVHGKAALDVLTQAAKASTAGLGKLDEVAQAMTSAKYSFGIPAKQIGDIVAQAAVLAHADPGLFFKSMGQAIPVASALKLKLEDVMGVVAIMTREKLSPAQAFTRMSAMAESLVAPTPKQRKVAQLIGIDFGEFRKEMSDNLGKALEDVYTKAHGKLDLIKQFFGGKKSGDVAMALFNPNALRENIDLLDRMHKSVGTVDHAFGIASKTLRVQAAQTKAALEGAAIAAEAALAPAARTAAADIRHLADSFSGLDPRTQANVVEALALAAAIGPVIRGVVGLTTATKFILGPLSLYLQAQKAVAAANAVSAGTATAAKLSIGAMAGAYAAAAAIMAVPILITIKAVYDFKDAAERAEKAGKDAASFAFGPSGFIKMKRSQGSKRTNDQLFEDFKKSSYYEPFMRSGPNGDHFDADRKAKAAIGNAASGQTSAADIAKRIAAITGGKGFDLSDSGAVGGKGRKGREKTDPLDQYRDQQYELQRSVALGPDAMKSAEMLYDIQHRHLDGLGEGGKGGVTWRDLKAFAERQGFDVTSTTGGIHNAGSKHYQGLAVDVRTRDKSPQEIAALMEEAKKQGYLVRDERTRPAGQKVWGGPHLHLEATGAGSASTDAEIVALAKRNYQLQLGVEAMDKSKEKRKDDADSLKEWLKDTQEAMKEAKRAHEEYLKEQRPEFMQKTRAEHLHEFSQAQFGTDFSDIKDPKRKKAALDYADAMVKADRAAWDKELASFTDQIEQNRNDAYQKIADRMAETARKGVEATRKSAEEFDAIMRTNTDRRDEGKAAPSLAARRAQYIKEEQAKLKSTGDLALDLDRQARVGKAAGEAFDAAPLRTYRSAVRDLSRQIAELGPQTDKARLAAIMYDEDGLQKMDEASARAILQLQKLTDKMREQKDQAKQAGDALGQAFTGAMTDGLNHGFSGFLRALVSNVDQAIRQAVLSKIAEGISKSVMKALGPKSPSVGTPPIAQAGGGGLFGALGTAFMGLLPHKAEGGSVDRGKPIVVGDGGDGSGSEVFVPSSSGNILPHSFIQDVSNMAKSQKASSEALASGETKHFHFSPTIHVPGPIDRRNQQQIKSAAYEGARRAFDELS